MKVRRAEPDDARGILEVHHRAVHELAASAYDDQILEAWSPPVDDERVEEFVDANFDSQPPSTVFVAVDDGRVLGVSAVVPADEYLWAVYVDPEFAGRGLGTALLRQAEWSAAQAEVGRLQLDASLNSVEFYEQNGYERVEEGTCEIDRGPAIPCVVMEKHFPG